MSKPRPYQVETGDIYVTTTLAPRLFYNGVDYVIDEGVESVPLRLYANDTLLSANPITDVFGLVHYYIDLGTSSALQVILRVVIDGASLLYEEVVEEPLVFNKIRVYDRSSIPNDTLKFNFTASNTAGEGVLYVGAQSQLEVEASLLDQLVSELRVSFVCGRLVSTILTNASGGINIPGSSDYMRALIQTDCLFGDVNEDGVVDGLDNATVAGALGSYPEHQDWNVDADLYHDNVVDSRDLDIAGAHWGEKASWVVFNTGQRVLLDSKGFASVPEILGDIDRDRDVDYDDTLAFVTAYITYWSTGECDPRCDFDEDGDVDYYDSVAFSASYASYYNGGEVTSLTLYEHGIPAPGVSVEFSDAVLNETLSTNSLGRVVAAWTPSEMGRYLTQVKLSSKSDVLSSAGSSITGLDALANLFEYWETVKRPVDLSVDYAPDEPTLDDTVTMYASCFDGGLGEPAMGLRVDFYLYDMRGGYIFMGSATTNASGVVAFSWNPRYYSETYNLFPDFVLRVVCVGTAFTLEAEVVPVHVDTRYPTRLEFLGDEVKGVAVGSTYYLTFKLTTADSSPEPVNGRWISVYINDAGPSSGQTNSSGMATMEWTPTQVGTYFFRASFSAGGDFLYKRSNEVRFVAVAQVIPMSILFDIQPREFKPEATITLTAQVLDPTTNQTPLRATLSRFTRSR